MNDTCSNRNFTKCFILVVFLILTVTSSHAALEITAGPYLQNPTETSMTVMWVTNANSTAIVHYGTGESPSTEAVSVTDGQIDANTTIHRVRISGLKAASEYSYRISSTEILKYEPYKVTYGETVSSSVYTFKTLNETHPDCSFVVFNDVHDGFARLQGRFEFANQPACDMVFLNGDIVNDPSSETQIIEKTLKPATDLFASETPFCFIRGNHETRGFFSRTLKSYLALPNNRYYYSFQQGSVYFIVLDSGEDKEDSHWAYSGLNAFDSYRDEQTEWLKAEIRKPAFKKASFRVALSHIPLFGKRNAHGATDCKQKWAALLNKGKIDLHLSGHTHRPKVITPVSGEHDYPIFVGGGPRDENATVIRVNATPKRMEVRMFDNSGNIIGQTEIKRRSGWAGFLN